MGVDDGASLGVVDGIAGTYTVGIIVGEEEGSGMGAYVGVLLLVTGATEGTFVGVAVSA